MSGRGRPTLEAWEQARLEEREAVIVTARCTHCPWTLEADVKTAREAHTKHRQAEHPEIKPKQRRRQHRPYRQFAPSRDLDDNIAAAREQGAASWAGPA